MSFWEIASLILQVVQMGYYVSALDHYKDKLEDLADWLHTSADNNWDHYKHFREMDPNFYDYYKGLPNYSQCESNVERGKGRPFKEYGRRLRRGINSSRGYSPLSHVHLNNMIAPSAIAETSVARVSNKIMERRRESEHILERWSAIVRAPVGVERYNPAITNVIYEKTMSSFKSAAHGFNSAGTAFGTTLYRILN